MSIVDGKNINFRYRELLVRRIVVVKSRECDQELFEYLVKNKVGYNTKSIMVFLTSHR